MDACMEMIFWTVPSTTHQSCRVSTFHISTTLEPFSLVNCFCIFFFLLFPCFLFHVECVSQLEQVVLLGMDKNDKINPLPQTLSCHVHKTLCNKTINPFLSSCCVEVLNFTIRFLSLKIVQGHVLKATFLVLSRCESLDLCIYIPTSVKSCWHWLTLWVRVLLASIYSKNGIANCGLADVSLVNCSFTCRDYPGGVQPNLDDWPYVWMNKTLHR